MRTIFGLLIVAGLLLISPSSEAFKSKKVAPGMTGSQVTEILGKADGYTREGNAELLTYTNKLISLWAWDRADFHVVLVDGRVAQYGFGNVRQGQPGINTFVIVPIR